MASLFPTPNAELVFGLVYPLGADRRPVVDALEDQLNRYGYQMEHRRLSEHLRSLNLETELESQPEERRIESYMDAGNEARRIAERADFLALATVSDISQQRSVEQGEPLPHPRRAYVLDSLKRPEEVAALREIYGPAFFLIGVSASESDRLHHLTQDKHISETEAERLMKRDLDEGEEYGQKTRETYHLSHVFVALGDDQSHTSLKTQVRRFVDLVFGHPYQTPTLDEHSMFLAYAASFRSADLSRQVGAAIVTEKGDVLAVGCNDVPKSGGGLYWPGEADGRDWKRGCDSNHERRDQMIADVIVRLLPDADEATVETMRSRMATSPLQDITEFGRAVHAEMDAILTCSRIGVRTVGATIYTTTFPCHNCTRHIVAAGIQRVFYVEPYPKSQATALHGDSISLKDRHPGSAAGRVVFEPFVGVGAHRYVDLFSMRLGAGRAIRRKNGSSGESLQWDPNGESQVRAPVSPVSYLARERLAARAVANTLEKLGRD
ncbi:MAG: dCMP deaminase family protein [Acidobacteria bacterium]|nr:dCMP deaminase family protein [Acidobacteriota bacterium]